MTITGTKLEFHSVFLQTFPEYMYIHIVFERVLCKTLSHAYKIRYLK